MVREQEEEDHGMQARMMKMRRVRSNIKSKAPTMSESVND
jgi:hypothetical protein